MYQPSEHTTTANWKPTKQMRVFYRITFCLLVACIIVKMIILGLETLGMRTGLPGGEIFIPLYAIIGPSFGWQLRGWQEPPKRRKKARRHCTTIVAKSVERTLIRETEETVKLPGSKNTWLQ